MSFPEMLWLILFALFSFAVFAVVVLYLDAFIKEIEKKGEEHDEDFFNLDEDDLP